MDFQEEKQIILNNFFQEDLAKFKLQPSSQTHQQDQLAGN